MISPQISHPVVMCWTERLKALIPWELEILLVSSVRKAPGFE